MGDTLRTRHRLHFWFLPMAWCMPIEGPTHGAGIFLVQMANQQIGEFDGVNTASELTQSHRMTDEGLADKTFAPSPTDLAIAADSSNPMPFQLTRIATGTSAVILQSPGP